MLRLLLQIDEDRLFDGEHNLEDDGRTMPTIRFDPSVENNYLDAHHIDSNFDDAADSKRSIFFKYVKNECELRNWYVLTRHVRWWLDCRNK